MKRRVKVWNKIRLYETSAVGIPAYPDAHAAVGTFSLVKALSNANLRPNSGFVEEKAVIGDTIKSTEEKKETMEENTSQAVEVAKAVETKVEATKTVEADKSDMSEMIAKAIKDGIKDGLKELEVERGVVEKAKAPVNKSLGEMAMEKGLFVKK